MTRTTLLSFALLTAGSVMAQRSVSEVADTLTLDLENHPASPSFVPSGVKPSSSPASSPTSPLKEEEMSPPSPTRSNATSTVTDPPTITDSPGTLDNVIEPIYEELTEMSIATSPSSIKTSHSPTKTDSKNDPAPEETEVASSIKSQPATTSKPPHDRSEPKKDAPTFSSLESPDPIPSTSPDLGASLQAAQETKEEFAIEHIPNLKACENYELILTGGKAPYVIGVFPPDASQEDWSSLELLTDPTTSQKKVAWNVEYAPGTQFSVGVQDANNQRVFSNQVMVVEGGDMSCLKRGGVDRLPSSENSTPGKAGLSTTATAVIIAVAIVSMLLVCLGLFFCLRRRKARRNQTPISFDPPPARFEIDSDDDHSTYNYMPEVTPFVISPRASMVMFNNEPQTYNPYEPNPFISAECAPQREIAGVKGLPTTPASTAPILPPISGIATPTGETSFFRSPHHTYLPYGYSSEESLQGRAYGRVSRPPSRSHSTRSTSSAGSHVSSEHHYLPTVREAKEEASEGRSSYMSNISDYENQVEVIHQMPPTYNPTLRTIPTHQMKQ